jgi:general L-amino acid transport system permease protein
MHGPAPLAPPAAARASLLDVLRGLFGSPRNAVLTLAMLGLFAVAVPPFLDWAIAHATWEGLSRKACAPDGACWAFIRARLPLFFYGRFPEGERWRVDVAMALLVAVATPALFARRRQGLFLFLLLFGVPPVGGVLLAGGVFGLEPVTTGDWGGLMLNVVLTFATVVGALPLGVALAFGRRSELSLVRWGSTAFIECWRGVPLLAVLFMGLVMLPLFLPNGVSLDALLRALVVLILFNSAYMAEAVRGGLQGVPHGQVDAALALGMHDGMAQVLVVLPQALRLSIPAIINIVIDLFKDTTLVSIVGLFELLGVVGQSLKDSAWLGLAREGYVFAAALFFVSCLVLSLAGQALERRYGQAPGGRR